MADTINVGDSGVDHPVGIEGCRACWNGYPMPCREEGCAGLVHTTFGDENADMDYWLYYKCDVCGSTNDIS